LDECRTLIQYQVVVDEAWRKTKQEDEQDEKMQHSARKSTKIRGKPTEYAKNQGKSKKIQWRKVEDEESSCN
jgi:hypothetical protein